MMRHRTTVLALFASVRTTTKKDVSSQIQHTRTIWGLNAGYTTSVTYGTVFKDRYVFHCHNRASLHTLQGRIDRYSGVHIDIRDMDDGINTQKFGILLKASMEEWKCHGNTAVWLDVPIDRAHLIPVAAEHGFLFHHAESTAAVLYQWLHPTQKSKLPQFATHQIGVSGCVVREDTKEVLVVRDKNRPYTLWKFPGGIAELGEDIGSTAERETLEETGIKSQFKGLLLFRQQHNHPGAFGRSDLFFVCRMAPLTFDIHPCEDEIEACQWMTLDEVEATMQTSAITQRTVHLIRIGLQNGFDQVDLSAEQFQSVYKGMQFKLFNRHLDDGNKGVRPGYLHSIVPPDEQK